MGEPIKTSSHPSAARSELTAGAQRGGQASSWTAEPRGVQVSPPPAASFVLSELVQDS